MTEDVASHLALTRAVDSWVRRLSPRNDSLAAEVAVDLADLLHAASVVRRELDHLLKADLDGADSAEAALQGAANIGVQLFTELKQHLESLEQHWPKIERALERQAESSP
jgi:hypothetical protein